MIIYNENKAMSRRFELSIKKMRKIMFLTVLRQPICICLYVCIFLCAYYANYCFLLGHLVDESKMESGFETLIILALLIAFLIYIFCRSIFTGNIGRGKKTAVIEFEFKDDRVLYKNVTRNFAKIINIKAIRKIYVIKDVIVVFETMVYFFPNEENIKKYLKSKNGK